MSWTTTALVQAALGPSVTLDAYAEQCVAAADDWARRQRRHAGYNDDPDPAAPAPGPDAEMGTTLYAVALWRERASTDSFPSFEEMSTFAPTAGTLGQIRRLLGIPRAATDRLTDLEAVPVAAMRRARRMRRVHVR